MANLMSRLIIWSLSSLLVLIFAVIIVLGLQVKREHAVVAERKAQLETELASLREERMEKEVYLRSFLRDKDFVERVIRERLGYVEPGEVIFRFED